MAAPLPEKTCAACGRRMVWRKRWARTWDSVRYCSDACRRRKPTTDDGLLEEAILRLSTASGAAGICPSEASRAVLGPSEGLTPDAVQRARAAARRLAARGEVVVMQHNQPVDPSTVKGPIRVKRPR